MAEVEAMHSLRKGYWMQVQATPTLKMKQARISYLYVVLRSKYLVAMKGVFLSTWFARPSKVVLQVLTLRNGFGQYRWYLYAPFTINNQ